MKIETRPWGRFAVLYQDKHTWLKRLIISPGQSLSYQSHENRDEVWITQDEGVRFIIDGQEFVMKPGMMYGCLSGAKHRLINTGATEASVLEWATGSPDESDIIRYADNYGRTIRE